MNIDFAALAKAFASELLATRWGGQRRMFGGEVRGNCPLSDHEDRRGSFGFNIERDCWACSCGSGKGSELRERLGYSNSLHSARPKVLREIRYPLIDAAGKTVTFHVRRELDDGTKTFVFDPPFKSRNIRRDSLPLYGLPELLKAQKPSEVIVTEGEKKADVLRKHGFVAVATATGADGKPGDDVLRPLVGHDVYLWPDNDDPGRKHMRFVGDALRRLQAAPRLIAWPEAGPKEDAADFFTRGGTADTLRALIKTAPLTAEAQPEPAPTKPAKVLQGKALDLPEPEPWPAPVDGAALLDEIAETFRRFLALPEGADIVLALWTLYVHAFDAFAVSPRLILSSPTKRCGKTTALSILARLVPRPLPTSNVSTAAVFRTIEAARPTLLIDEADTFATTAEELRGILNSGHTRSAAYVIRTVGEDHEPRKFSTWTPVVLAGIGKMPDTIEDRSVIIPMRRRAKGEAIEKARMARLDALAPLASKAARWAADHFEKLRTQDPASPESLDDRAADNWRPLLAVAEMAGEKWPELARKVALTLSGQRAEEPGWGVQLLNAVRRIFEDQNTDRLSSKDLCDRLAVDDEGPWKEYRKGKPITLRQIAALLNPFDIQPGTIRPTPATTAKGYMLSDFADAFARYPPPQDPSQRHGAFKSGSQGHKDEIRDPSRGESVTDPRFTGNRPGEALKALGDAVTDRNPPEGDIDLQEREAIESEGSIFDSPEPDYPDPG